MALRNLGDLYEKGFGVKQDFLRAKEYYEMFAKHNNSDSLLKLGDLYFYGLGVPKDYNKAKEYYNEYYYSCEKKVVTV